MKLPGECASSTSFFVVPGVVVLRRLPKVRFIFRLLLSGGLAALNCDLGLSLIRPTLVKAHLRSGFMVGREAAIIAIFSSTLNFV